MLHDVIYEKLEKRWGPAIARYIASEIKKTEDEAEILKAAEIAEKGSLLPFQESELAPARKKVGVGESSSNPEYLFRHTPSAPSLFLAFR